MMPFAGRIADTPTARTRCGSRVNRPRASSRASITVSSVVAIDEPMQRWMPPPNGRYSEAGRRTPSSQRSGRNYRGSAYTFSSRWVA